MQLGLSNRENNSARYHHAVFLPALIFFVVLFALPTSRAFAADGDIGAELDQAEGLSGGTPAPLTPPPTPETTATTPVPVPKTQESKAIPLSNDPTLEAPSASSEAVAPPPETSGPNDGVTADEKQKTLESKGVGEDSAGAPREDVPTQKVCNCKFEATVPYRDRRPAISGFFGLEVGSYSPVNYTPDFVSTSFANYYSQTPMSAGLNFGAKYNSAIGAIGVQMGGSFFTTTNAADASTLTVIPATIGIIAELNTLFSEPYVVPYAIFGEYTGIYSEKAGAFSVKGNSPFSQFYAVGLMFQLDWIDPESHIDAYEGFGLENTFIYVEGRQYFSSGTGIPDLSTPLQVAGGLKLEF